MMSTWHPALPYSLVQLPKNWLNLRSAAPSHSVHLRADKEGLHGKQSPGHGRACHVLSGVFAQLKQLS